MTNVRTRSALAQLLHSTYCDHELGQNPWGYAEEFPRANDEIVQLSRFTDFDSTDSVVTVFIRIVAAATIIIIIIINFNDSRGQEAQ